MGAENNTTRLNDFVCFYIIEKGMQYVVNNYIHLREQYYASKTQ